jgi:hypothetical protein
MARPTKQKTFVALPAQFAGDFFQALLDEGTEVALAAHQRCTTLMEKSAGDNEPVKAAYVRNYVALNLMLEGMVLDLVRGQRVDPGALTQLMAQENGIGRILGLAAKPPQSRRLGDVMGWGGSKPQPEAANA